MACSGARWLRCSSNAPSRLLLARLEPLAEPSSMLTSAAGRPDSSSTRPLIVAIAVGTRTTTSSVSVARSATSVTRFCATTSSEPTCTSYSPGTKQRYILNEPSARVEVCAPQFGPTRQSGCRIAWREERVTNSRGLGVPSSSTTRPATRTPGRSAMSPTSISAPSASFSHRPLIVPRCSWASSSENWNGGGGQNVNVNNPSAPVAMVAGCSQSGCWS
jgi:hypothetical protein